MKRQMITAAMAVAALGGVGTVLVAASWPDGGRTRAIQPEPIRPVIGAAPQDESMREVRTAVTGGASPTAAASTPAPGGTATSGSAGRSNVSGTSGSTGIISGSSGSSDPTGGSDSGSGSSSGSGDADQPGCDLGPWDLRVQGRPAGLSGGDRAGDYLWHTSTGFHLAVTHRGDRRDVFTGTITANEPMALRPVRLEGRDAVALSADRRTLYFRFFDYGHIDAVDLVTACATRLVVGNLRVDGQPLPTDRIYLGATRAHPAQVPFTLTRDAP